MWIAVNVLVAGTYTELLYGIAIDSGKVRWRHQTTRYGNHAANWDPMMAELVTFEGKLYCLDMNQVLHVLALEDGRELLRVRFAHDLRPSVNPLKNSRAVMASESGEVQLVQW